MKNSVTFEEQTEEIVEALLSGFIRKKSNTAFRELRYECSEEVSLEGASGSATTFNPVAIASRLTNIADKYNEDLEQPARSIIAEIVEKKVEQFGKTVESLSKTWINQYGLQYEEAFLIIGVKLFMYLGRKASDIAQSSLLTTAINGNPQVRDYIEHQGGWENFHNNL